MGGKKRLCLPGWTNSSVDDDEAEGVAMEISCGTDEAVELRE